MSVCDVMYVISISIICSIATPSITIISLPKAISKYPNNVGFAD